MRIDVKKIKDLRASKLSLREIAEKLKITRKEVEIALASKTPKITKESKGTTTKSAAKPTTKGK